MLSSEETAVGTGTATPRGELRRELARRERWAARMPPPADAASGCRLPTGPKETWLGLGLGLGGC